MKAVSTALTFDPPPLKVLRPESAPMRLSTNAQRIAWFSMLGVEAAVVLPFTMELARLAPEDFVEQILVRRFAGGGDFSGGKLSFRPPSEPAM